MNPEEKINKIKEQNRARAKRYYLKNKDVILERQKNTKKLFIPEPITNEPTARTIAFYNDTLKTLYKILETDKPNFNKYNDIIKKINNASHNEKLYSINSKKNFYQLILKMIYTNQIKVNVKSFNKYKYNYELLNIISKDKTKIKQNEETVLTFDEYLPLIKNEFGEDSKEYLIVKLYSFYGFRDDLILTITDKIEEDTTKNFIIISPDDLECIIILNEYKTKKRYGQDVIKLSDEICHLIQTYKINNNLNNNDLLFNNKSLSGYIKKFNNKINLNITINKLRQMKVSEKLNQSTTPEERLELSKTMKHSPETSNHYKRNN
jgi:hypothetical protein